MLEIITGEASKAYKNKKSDKEQLKKDKYALMKRFHYDHQLQVYMYAFMYIYPETTQEEDYFPSKFVFVKNYKKCQLQD